MWLSFTEISTAKDKLSRLLRQANCTHQCSRGIETRHVSAAPCTARPSVMARARGMLLEAFYAISTSPRLLALCTAAFAPSLPWRRVKHTLDGFRRGHRSAGELGESAGKVFGSESGLKTCRSFERTSNVASIHCGGGTQPQAPLLNFLT